MLNRPIKVDDSEHSAYKPEIEVSPFGGRRMNIDKNYTGIKYDIKTIEESLIYGVGHLSARSMTDFIQFKFAELDNKDKQLELKDKEIQELKKQIENYCQDCLDRV